MCWTANSAGAMTDSGEDFTVGFARANILALLFAVPVCAVFLLLYVTLHGTHSLLAGVQVAYEYPVGSLFVFAFGVVVHEALHAAGWSWADGISWRDIHFGFKWSTITPYVHCPVPVTVRSYRFGTALPGVVLGIVPLLVSILLQNGGLLLFGLLFTIAAGGDFLILWLLRKADSRTRVRDHPDLIGCRLVS